MKTRIDGVTKTFSVITIANNEAQYKEFKDCLEKQKDCNYELIKIDNLNGEFLGARQAFNEAAIQATGEYLLFIHPDIRFLNERVLFEIQKEISRLGNFGVVGVAGVKKQSKHKIYSNIFHGEDQRLAGESILVPETVQTVDECLFIMKRSIWMENKFSSKMGWHLYAVEQCLSLERKGYCNYVIPTDGIWHISDGKSENAEYYVILKKILHEYKSENMICTTVKNWTTLDFKSRLLVNLYWIDRKFFKRR